MDKFEKLDMVLAKTQIQDIMYTIYVYIYIRMYIHQIIICMYMFQHKRS